MTVNMSVWESVETLERFVWQTIHKRSTAAVPIGSTSCEGPHLVMWWIAAGHRPDV